jgi:hypothetical protein
MKTKIIVFGVAFAVIAYWLLSNKNSTAASGPAITPPTPPPTTGDSGDSGPALNITNF